MNTFVEKYKGLDIYFEALDEELMTLSELFPDDTPEQIKEISEKNVLFCAKISAQIGGVELSECEYLGGCIYENIEDFYTKYKEDYYKDMRNSLYNNALNELNSLSEQIKEITNLK